MLKLNTHCPKKVLIFIGCVLSLGDSALIDSGTEDSDLEDRILDPDTTRPDLGSRLPIKQGAGFCNCSIS